MLAVALLSLKTDPEVEAPALAKDLGVTAYEAGQLVRGILPSVVLKTEDATRAQQLAAALVARGHAALTCDLSEVARHPTMFSPRGFRLSATAFIGVVNAGEQTVVLTEVRALIRANHVAQVETLKKEQGKAFSMGKAVITGGLMMTKKVEKETLVRSTEKEPTLYLFPRVGPPWLLQESALKYDGLGASMKPGRPENFVTLCRTLKEAAPGALYDERLVQFKGAAGAPNTPDTLDLLAHLLASTRPG